MISTYSTVGLMCALVVRGNPEFEARRDKLVVRMILPYTLRSHLTSHLRIPYLVLRR